MRALVCFAVAIGSAGCTGDFCADYLHGCKGTTGAGGQSSSTTTSTSGTTATVTSSTTTSTGGTTTGTSGTTSASTSASTGTGIATSCIPTVGVAVADACGVFVSVNGNDSNAGTPAAPFKNVDRAILAVQPDQAIYICEFNYSTNGGPLPPGVSMFGGLDCNTWKGNDTNHWTSINVNSDQPPLTFSGAAMAYIENTRFYAQNANNKGDSSIAVVADGANLTVVQSTFQGGYAASADPGGQESDNAASGNAGFQGHDACYVSPPSPGAPEVALQCGAVTTIGGMGGNGGATMTGASAGAPGLPSGAAGEGGMPQGTAMWNCMMNGHGADGTKGAAGMGGSGGTGPGNLSPTGYKGDGGADGTPGTTGQGGGGGGGAFAPMSCMNGMDGGAAGGGGGTGGCGGNPGKGGKPGGASIGFVSINSTVVFQSCVFESQGAGDGGDGGAARNGGMGGMGGGGGNGGTGTPMNTSASACPGGKGGDGGPGGSGGGGQGGPSVCIAFVGTAPTGATSSQCTHFGNGGNGGASPMPAAGTSGANGKGCFTQDFGAGTCTP